LAEAKDFEGLLFGDEAALDPESLLGDLLAAAVTELFHVLFVSLLIKIPTYF
jgi:hypothetical protein